MASRQLPHLTVLIILASLFFGGLMLVVSCGSPSPQGAGGVGRAPDATATIALANTASTASATPTPKPRPFAGPPPTSASIMFATPDYATNVPLPLTGNFDSSQLALGRTTYANWCASCHGDRGQGLALWRSSWDPAHQNCTQAGCHGQKHPPDGFMMLKIPPPLIGPNSLPAFQTAQQLFIFIRAAMPYQAPGVFSDEEYWAVTAFLADQHGADARGKVLNDAIAGDVVLH